MEQGATEKGMSGFFDLGSIDLLPSLVLHDTNTKKNVYVPPQWMDVENKFLFIFYDGVKKIQLPRNFLSRDTSNNCLYVANVDDGNLRTVYVEDLICIPMN